jgi:hypothetical protein
MMKFDQFLANRKPETRPTIAGPRHAFKLTEILKGTGKVLGGDPFPRIRNLAFHKTFPDPEMDLDVSLVRELQRVMDQMIQHLNDLVAIDIDLDRFGHKVREDLELFPLCDGLEIFCYVQGYFNKITKSSMEADLAGLQP